VEFREIWEQVHYGPAKGSLNFGSDTEHIEGSVHKGSISRNANFSGNELLCFASFTS